jgi:hypothetical protein
MASNQKTVKFYKNRGFFISKFHDGFYHIEAKYHDAYEMTLPLPASRLNIEQDLEQLMLPTNMDITVDLIAKDQSTGHQLTALLFIVLFVLLLVPFFNFVQSK